MYTQSIYSFLWNMIRPYKWHYFIMFMAPILAGFYDFANQYALKLLIDAFSVKTDISYQALFFPITLFISAQVLLDVIWRISDVAEWRSEPKVRRSIILYTVDYIQHHSYAFFQNTQTGKIISKIRGILDGYDNFWASLHHEFTPKIANTIILTSVLAVVNLRVCFFVSLWAVSFFTIMYHLSKRLDRLSYVNANTRHKIFGIIGDNIANIFTLFSFASRNYEKAKLEKTITNEFIPNNVRTYKFSFFLNIISALLYWVMLISLFLYMIHLRKTHQATSGDLVFVMGITLKMSMDLWSLIGKMQDFMRNIGDFKSAFKILQIPHVKNINNLKKINIINPSIRFENVNFSYDQNMPILHNLNLDIKPGEKIGIVGSSGAGKSTIVSLLLKYFSVNQGRIFISDLDINLYSEDSIRKQVAVIPQDISLFHRNIIENIRYGNLNASDEEVINACQLANIHDYIMGLPKQYQTIVGERGVKLSGGQRQRI
ncbi:MAG: mdlB, partial [Francisellaceae bacterium]|nr:mdlB [Francisellaceae bacterium]